MNGQFYHKGRPYNFGKIGQNLSRVKRELPAVLTTAAVNHFKDSFRNQGFTDRSLKRWPERKPSAPRNRGRGILMDSGYLRNSIRTGLMSFVKSEVATDAPYAEVHNEGFSGMVQVKTHSRRNRYTGRSHRVKTHSRQMNMPRRQFMGNSDQLENEIERLIDQRVLACFNL